VNKSCRKLIVVFSFVFLIQSTLFLPLVSASTPPLFRINAKAAVLIDAVSGQVIFEQNPQKEIPPASLVKIMTLYLVYDALKMGLVKPDDEVLISRKAWATKGSKMFVEVGKRVKLHKLMEGIASISGNDACVAVAEYLAGLEEAFVARMSEKASSLGIAHTQFKNVNGLPAKGQYTTALDVGTLVYHYLKNHPEALKIHSIKKFTFGGITQYNRNGLLWLGEGIDGLKTGWIDNKAGFHLVATAKKNDQRFIAVVMGARDQRTRENEALKLLNYGFKNFSTVKMFNANESIETVSVWKGKSSRVYLIAAEPGIVTVPVGEKQHLSLIKEVPERIFAPINKGEKIGELAINLKGKLLKGIDLIAQDEVPSGGVIKCLIHMGILTFIVPPHWGCIVLLLLFLLIVTKNIIKKKVR